MKFSMGRNWRLRDFHRIRQTFPRLCYTQCDDCLPIDFAFNHFQPSGFEVGEVRKGKRLLTNRKRCK